MTDQNNSTDTLAKSPNPADARRAQLAALIPEAFSEGLLDVAALKRALGGEAMIEGVFYDSDPLKSNLDLQCQDAKIKFTCL